MIFLTHTNLATDTDFRVQKCLLPNIAIKGSRKGLPHLTTQTQPKYHTKTSFMTGTIPWGFRMVNYSGILSLYFLL